ncbi:hypothetical protein ACIRS1_27420 [Kitasatospora sp. NPDC101176]|uniref:hypothetical protein n=1 Tax=Kitasatospora sp. NPDC101176 TaxID=3364099 RepID=UPI00383023B3
MIVYPGFETQEAARHMAHSHGVLRWREHAVGRAVEAKRRAGLAATLTLEELQAAFRQCTEPASVPSGSGGV